jgi:hypothetical protein
MYFFGLGIHKTGQRPGGGGKGGKGGVVALERNGTEKLE